MVGDSFLSFAYDVHIHLLVLLAQSIRWAPPFLTFLENYLYGLKAEVGN